MLAAMCRAGAVILLVAGAARAEDGTSAIETPGMGTLTMCQSRIISTECNLYHHIQVPTRMAIGDKVMLVFGSNTKRFNFPVARIVKNGTVCIVLSDADGDPQTTDRIEIDSCRDITGAHH